MYFLVMLIVSSCHNRGNVPIDKNVKSIESFESFYSKFYQDSIFQKERVKFPIKGILNSNDIHGEYIWTENNWHRIYTIKKDSIIDGQLYKKEIKKFYSIVTDRVYIDSAGFETICRYKLIENKWYLVYFSSSNL